MKRQIIYLLIISILSIGCSKKDDPTFEYEPLSIEFILQDGTPIMEGDCIDPNANYAVRIRVSTEDNDNTNTTVIQYTVNGNLSSITFNNSLSRMINVPIVEGINIAELVDSGMNNSIYLVAESEFVIVP